MRSSIAALTLLGLGWLAACAPAADASVVGTWGADNPGQPNLVLAEDGTLSGTDGCNRLTGSWKAEDDAVTFGPIASTRMFCEGVDDWLGAMASATVDGSTMTIRDSDGAEIGTLAKA